MKKILLFGAFIALAIVSFGGTIVLAHAQTAQTDTAAGQATLQQQLELMKDKLELLQLQQMQGGQTGTPTQAVTPTAVAMPVVTSALAVNISPADASALNSALSALASTLVSLQSAVQNDPQFMTNNGPVIARSLAGIEGSLAMVLTSMQNGSAQVAPGPAVTTSNSAPLVMANPTPAAVAPAAPSDGSAQGSNMSANTNPALPSVDSLTQPANTVPANTQNTETAAVAASALAGKNRLPAIIVGIILLAMIAILVWGRGSEELEPVVVRSSGSGSGSGSGKPTPTATPVMPVPPSISFVSNQQSSSSSVTMSSSTPTPSPLASAMNQNQQRKI